MDADPRLVKFYGRDLDGLHMPFNFQLITLPWRPAAVHRAIVDYERRVPRGAWPNWVLGNHDKPRLASRVGAAQARAAAVLLLTLRGTPTLYYGDELGMTDFEVALDAQQDPQGLRGGESRDPERTPMRWDAGRHAGFSTAPPWLPIGDNQDSINASIEGNDPGSMLSLYRRLLALRHDEPALHSGKWLDLGRNDKAIAYLRFDGQTTFLIVANLTASPAEVPEAAQEYAGKVVVTTLASSRDTRFDADAGLKPNEAIVVVCTNASPMRT